MTRGARPEGVNVIGEGVALWASLAFVDITEMAERVLSGALRLIPPDSP